MMQIQPLSISPLSQPGAPSPERPLQGSVSISSVSQSFQSTLKNAQATFQNMQNPQTTLQSMQNAHASLKNIQNVQASLNMQSAQDTQLKHALASLNLQASAALLKRPIPIPIVRRVSLLF
jgi:hypothetical protein